MIVEWDLKIQKYMQKEWEVLLWGNTSAKRNKKPTFL